MCQLFFGLAVLVPCTPYIDVDVEPDNTRAWSRSERGPMLLCQRHGIADAVHTYIVRGFGLLPLSSVANNVRPGDVSSYHRYTWF